MEENSAPTLFTTDHTGNYVEYTPPEPPSFQETLPEDIRENEHLNEVKDNAQLARYYVDLKANYLKPPDTADGYEFESPDGFDLDEEAYKQFREIAFEDGVNQKQFSSMMNFEAKRYVEEIKPLIEKVNLFEKAIEEQNADQEKAETELKAEWGDKYEKNMESAKQFLNDDKVKNPAFAKFLEDSRFGDNPHVIRMFAKLSELLSEDGFQQPGKGDKAAGPLIGEDGRLMLSFPSMEE